MRYRTLIDHPRPAEADFDAVDADAAALRAQRESDLAMLKRIAEVGMELIETIGQNARTDPTQAFAAGQAFGKVSLAVRRTMALHRKLSLEAEPKEAERRAAREQRCADEVEAHTEVKTAEITRGLEDAWAAGCAEEEREHDQGAFGELVDSLELSLGLEDGDELRDYLDRPVGETVAKLCAALGLDAAACKFEDGEWRVRRPPTRFERGREAFVRRRPAAPVADPVSEPLVARDAHGPP